MPDIDTASEASFGRDWTKLAALALVSMGLVVASVYGTQIEQPTGYHERNFHRLSFVVLPGSLAMFAFAVYRLCVPFGGVIRVGPAGFQDLRAGSERVPWPEVRNVVLRGTRLFLTLNQPYARRYRFSIGQRLAKKYRSAAGPSHLLVSVWGIDAELAELTEHVTALWKAHGEVDA